MSAGSHTGPRWRTLGTHAKNPRERGRFSGAIPRCGRRPRRPRAPQPSRVCTGTAPTPSPASARAHAPRPWWTLFWSSPPAHQRASSRCAAGSPRVPGALGAWLTGPLVVGCTGASRWRPTGPPRWSRPPTGGRAGSQVPRPPGPWRPQRRLPAALGACFSPPVPELGGPRRPHTAKPRPCLCQRGQRDLQAPALQPPSPDWQRLRRSRPEGGSPLIPAWVPGVPRGALTGGCRVSTAALEDGCARTRGAGEAVWPASGAARLRARSRSEQRQEMDLHHGTPGRGGDMGGHPSTTSSHATTLESNKSVDGNNSL
jgi:hypothetical protein